MDASITDIFRFHKGTYYRAMTGLSFYVDAWLWNLKPAVMHLHNILIHILNACLVFIIIRQLINSPRSTNSFTPLLASILFLVHPINTESVNWISGRADPLATLFSLSAISLLLLSIKSHRYWPIVISAFMLTAGSFAKEPAYALFPGFIIIILFFKFNSLAVTKLRPTRRWRFACCLPFIAGLLTYGFIRLGSYGRKVDIGTKMIVETVVEEVSLWSKIEIMVATFGFYLKKLFIPFPQSFAINSISQEYYWFGLILGIIIVLLILQRNIFAAVLLLMILPIVPALLVAVIKFAFLPSFAERYLYMSSAFMALALGILSFKESAIKKPVLLIMLTMIVVFTPMTFKRNLLWSNHLKLLEDSNIDNQADASLWHAYCVVLADNEQFDKARNEYHKLMQKFPDDQTAYTNLAKLELYVDKPNTAFNVVDLFFKSGIEPELKTLIAMEEISEDLLEKQLSDDLKATATDRAIQIKTQLYDETKTPEYLLEAAKLSLNNQRVRQARQLADQVIQLHESNDTIIKLANEILTDIEKLKL